METAPLKCTFLFTLHTKASLQPTAESTHGSVVDHVGNLSSSRKELYVAVQWRRCAYCVASIRSRPTFKARACALRGCLLHNCSQEERYHHPKRHPGQHACNVRRSKAGSTPCTTLRTTHAWQPALCDTDMQHIACLHVYCTACVSQLSKPLCTQHSFIVVSLKNRIEGTCRQTRLSLPFSHA